METTFTLAHILEPISGYRPTGQEPPLTDVVTDSREAGAGSLFVALVGEHHDGHDFAAEAIERGAAALLVERAVVPDLLTIDLRGEEPSQWPERWETPVQIVVDDAVWAIQEAAAAWRAGLPVRVIGITGSVGKTST